MGMVVFPISFVLLKHLPDKGYAFSKVLALLLLGYLSWLMGYVSFGAGTILLAFILIAAFSAVDSLDGCGSCFSVSLLRKKSVFYCWKKFCFW